MESHVHAAGTYIYSEEPITVHVNDPFPAQICTWIGIALIAAFVLPIGIPVPGGSTVFHFINFEGLNLNLPGLLKFELVYPLIAGIVVLIVAGSMTGVGRAIALLATGVLPFFILWTSRGVSQGVSQIISQLGGMGSSMVVGGLLGVVGFIGMFAGSRARSVRPMSTAAAAIGTIGAAAYLVTLLIPSGASGELPLIAPFRMMFSEEVRALREALPPDLMPSFTLMGLFAATQMGLMIASAVLCIMNAPAHRLNAGPTARRAFLFFLASLGVAVLGMIVTTMPMISAMKVSALAILTIVLKVVLWLFVLFFLMLMGVTEWIVAASDARAASIPAVPVAPPVYTPPPAPEPTPQERTHERLRILQRLLDDSLITKEDYERKKTQIMEML